MASFPRCFMLHMFWRTNSTVVVTPLKVTNPTSPFHATNMTAYDNYFELTAEILLGRTKGQDLTPVETKHPSFTPINKCGFHGLRNEKSGAKVDKKKTNHICLVFFFPPVFSSPPQFSLFFLSLHHSFCHSHHNTTVIKNYSTFSTNPTPRRQQKPSPTSPTFSSSSSALLIPW